MAFWGIEVKPGKPFTHFFDSVRGRLRISQATLGIGSTTIRSLVQCNVGKKSPVLVCCLLPDKVESCSLDLEFEEVDDVIFSVIGPRSVHLTGYYLRNGPHSNLNEDTDSYGEDVGHTESEESNREEDEYDDSFIDDDDPKAYSPSPMSNGRVVIEETSDDDKPKQGKVRKRLKKKYQLSESDNDDNPQQQKVGDHITDIVILESDDEDSLPISSICKTKNTAHNRKVEEEKKVDNGRGEPERNWQSGLPTNSLMPSIEVVGPEIDVKRKKKRKERSKEKKSLEDCSVNNINVLDDDKTKQDDTKSNSMGQDPPLKTQQNQQAANDKRDLSLGHSMPSTEVSPENGARPKKKRKLKSKEEKPLEAENAYHSNALKEEKDHQDGPKADNMCLDHYVRSEPHSKPDTNTNLDNGADQKQPEEIYQKKKQPEEKKIKKKRKGRKNQENEEDVNTNVPRLSTNEVNRSVMDIEVKNSPVNSSQIRKLSNGLIIEELETGKPDGKVASQGKKVSIRYIGKLKESGQIFDSNIDGAPYKFRLGVGKVIEGWNVGLDGMRVGDKRRLEIPPSMSYVSQGDNENVPPNSWLVFDVEMVAVR